MHEPNRSGRHALGQTWRHSHDVRATQDRACSVSTLRVQFIGTPPESGLAAVTPRPSVDKTKLYASVLPSCEDCIPHVEVADDAQDWRTVSWRDVACLEVEPDHTRQALAFAQTLPAIPRVEHEHEHEESGVREISRLRLALDPRDSEPGAEQTPRADSLTPTMRVTRSADAPLTRAWQFWQQQPPFVAIATAITFCFVSALVVNWLAP